MTDTPSIAAAYFFVHSTIVRAGQGHSSTPNLASVLQEGEESANIHLSSRIVRCDELVLMEA